MIKLKSLIKESSSNQRPDKTLDAFLLQNKTVSLSEWLYHGSPLLGLKDILVNGIQGTQHGEAAEYDSFSTSLNSNIMSYFSEGDGETGLQFKVTNAKIIVLDDIMTRLMTQLPGSGLDVEVDENELNTFCKTFNVPIGNYKQEPYLPYGYLSSLGVDAFMYEYVWKRFHSSRPSPHNEESEICFIGNGIDNLNKWIESIWVDGNEYSPKEKEMALRDIEERI